MHIVLRPRTEYAKSSKHHLKTKEIAFKKKSYIKINELCVKITCETNNIVYLFSHVKINECMSKSNIYIQYCVYNLHVKIN